MTDLERVTIEAIDVFGTEEMAAQWLNTYHRLLDAKPIDYLESKEGFLILMQILSSIKYGGVV